jgi:hypothetical protein
MVSTGYRCEILKSTSFWRCPINECPEVQFIQTLNMHEDEDFLKRIEGEIL